ncbi:cornifelin homolog [Micropterus salmoides]|uniref:cornifelin homolog n=1 Tax=Micropterus salmoides TaxID=27706 RepID=UPI0018EC4E2B|nr:cornifelin homolog [Micropterus salmoides]XP_038588018.1 cornifelin homolog [Micropterus salmoides]
MATNVFINNNQPQAPILIAAQSNQWSTGIWGCFDDLSVCCFASWCFPWFACNTASEFGECFCLPLLDVIPSCTPPVSMSMRVAVRHRYKIQGDMTGDCLYSTICNTCSWCQIAREIKRRSQVLTVIPAQPVQLGAQQYMMTTQMGVVTSQPVISAAPQGIVTNAVM